MIWLKAVEMKKSAVDSKQFPLNLPLIQSMDKLEFDTPVTLLVGENGTGKSTLMEGVAAAIGSITVGAEGVEEDSTLEHARRLAEQIKLTWRVRTKRGFFLRAEDFFNFTKKLSQIRSDMEAEIRRVEEAYKDKSAYAKGLAMMPYKRSLYEMEHMYEGDLDGRSHGESFLKLFEARFAPKGVYLLDEPEAPLSPMRQLSLLSMLKEKVEEHDAQFIIATHSPILMAFPGASIFCFDEIPARKVSYEELEHVSIMRAFLNHPDHFLKYL
jgi:predicted ATPase